MTFYTMRENLILDRIIRSLLKHNVVKIKHIRMRRDIDFFFFSYKEDLLTYKNLQKYATKYIHMYNMKYNKMAA